MARVKLSDGREFDEDSPSALDYYRGEGAVITGEQAVAGADFPKVFDGGEYVKPSVEAGVDDAPAPVEQPVDAAPERSLYKHVGVGPVDPQAWPDSGLKDAAGDPLYTFVDDTEPGQANGASQDWVVTPAAPSA